MRRALQTQVKNGALTKSEMLTKIEARVTEILRDPGRREYFKMLADMSEVALSSGTSGAGAGVAGDDATGCMMGSFPAFSSDAIKRNGRSVFSQRDVLSHERPSNRCKRSFHGLAGRTRLDISVHADKRESRTRDHTATTNAGCRRVSDYQHRDAVEHVHHWYDQSRATPSYVISRIILSEILASSHATSRRFELGGTIDTVSKAAISGRQ